MSAIEHLVNRAHPRIETLRPGDVADDGRCVLWWISRAARATSNHAANTAVDLANQLKLPVVAVFCLVPGYPGATLRPYQFMAEGLAGLPDQLKERNIGWILRTGETEQVIPDAAKELGAAVVVTDLDPLRPGRHWRTAVSERLKTPMLVVDTDTVVPSSRFSKEEWTPRTIRPKIHRLLGEELLPIPSPKAHSPSDVHEAPDPVRLVKALKLDDAAIASPEFTGGAPEATKRLAAFTRSRLETYETDRNRSDIDGSSRLSPYLHFGQISPTEVALAITRSDAPQASIDAFINEIIVQRELCINFALRNPNYDRYAGIPDWGRKTLAKHAADPREHVYERAELEACNTDDRLWNAAQRQMVAEGWMPNRLRMYWAKQLLVWSKSPETAFQRAVYLNDRYFIDGRDANGYAGIAWSIGGRHDRPFPPERPILGLVRPMSARGMKKHFDTEQYIAQINERYGQ